ncbi:MAG: dockerin type I repeat-containing protein [Ruminococcus sp.]|nr:dockerin type I repeat-containing protein [Ruminococcus sp.]
MKKFIKIALCTMIISGAISTETSAKSEPIFLENGSEHWEYTYLRGDINNDRKISVADAVLLQKWIMDKYNALYDGNVDESFFDINFDGFIDSFDLVQMRKLVINPKDTEIHKYTIDILNTDMELSEKFDNFSNHDNIITEYNNMSEYLKTFITDSDELNKYLDRYNEIFFEENNLILIPYIQERGNGILTVAGGAVRIKKGIFFYIGGSYKQDIGLYPATNTKMLVQITFPKSQTSADDKILYSDWLSSQQSDTVSYNYGKNEIVVTQNNSMGINANIYIKNDDSFIYIDSAYPYQCFEADKLSTENYKITFRENSFIFEYKSDIYHWFRKEYSYSGDLIASEYYEK